MGSNFRVEVEPFQCPERSREGGEEVGVHGCNVSVTDGQNVRKKMICSVDCPDGLRILAQ
jgi:hypothetical protein